MAEETSASGFTSSHVVPITGIPGQLIYMMGGMAVGDFNNDGWQDVFVIGGGAAADHLFINDGDGTFADQAAAWGIDQLHMGMGASTGDFNNDGWLDLYVTSAGPTGSPPQVGSHRLYRNDSGSGKPGFVNVASQAGVNMSSPTNPAGFGSAFGDYDLDGDLDLCVTSWWGNADGVRLFRNNGNETFSDVTVPALGDGVFEIWAFQPAFADMDGDLYPELLIAADFETSRYLVNHRDGTFTDTTASSGLGLDDNGMGQCVGDVNNDLLLDWYVTSIHKTNPQPGDNVGNMLYLNAGGHQYDEVSVAAGCNDGGWGWGACAADLDQDGWIDLVEVNGKQGNPQYVDEPAKLFRNDGDGTFSDVALACGFDYTAVSTSVAVFDADNDGDQDIFGFTNLGAHKFFRNITPELGGWLRLTFDTSDHPLLAPNGSGTRIEAVTGKLSQVRMVNSSPSYCATSEWATHFGFGDAPIIDEVRITWARGQETVLQNVRVNQALVIEAPHVADINADAVVNGSDLGSLLLNWGQSPGPATLKFDLNGDGAINGADLGILLVAWGR
jgi:hypothetical protein